MTTHFVNLLEEVRCRVNRMASLVEDIVQEACEAAIDSNRSVADRVILRDHEVDLEEVEIESQIIRLMALYQPVGADLRLLCAMLKINNDLERISDSAINIAERAKHLEDTALGSYSDIIQKMEIYARQMLRQSIQSFTAEDIEAAKQVFYKDDRVDMLYEETVRKIAQEGSITSGEMSSRLDILSIAKNLERIADHATNIAEDVIYLCTGEIVRHAELRQSE